MFRRRSAKPVASQVGADALAGRGGFGAPFGIHYTRHTQPDPGIAAYSYDTLALPLFSPIGPGVQNQRQFDFAPSSTVLYQLQGVQLTTIGNPGYLVGSFVGPGPLIDTQSNQGDIQAPAIAMPGANEIPAGAL